MSKIKVLVYPVGCEPYVKDIGDDLSDMQDIVGGYIQYVDLGAMAGIKELYGYDLYCNEEGKLEGLPMNRMFPHDYIAGQFFVSKTGDEGEGVTLTDSDIELIKKYIK